MRRFLSIAATMIVALCVSACDGWLDVETPENKISYLTEDVNFTAESVIFKRYEGIYANYPEHANYFMELHGPKRDDGTMDAMILDLLVPKDNISPVGEYAVGYAGKYVALSHFEVYDPMTGFQYYGGCYYGLARDGYIGDYYGFLTEGKVTISELEGNYYVTVDAKSEEYNVYVHYQGPLELTESEE